MSASCTRSDALSSKRASSTTLRARLVIRSLLPPPSLLLLLSLLSWLVGVLAGCASALPGLDGGGTTPARRTDALMGGAARIPLGGGAAIAAEDALAGGVNPVAAVRHGLRRGLDLGLLGSGTDGALALRAEHVLAEATTRRVFIYGARAYGGAVVARRTGDDRGYRLGVDFPLLFALDVGGIYEGFFGLRGGAEFLQAEGAEGEKRGAIVRLGPSLGFGVGLRRLHGAIELGVGVEARTGSLGRADGRVGGYLLPAFALRLRP